MGISAELIDPRVLIPFDKEKVFASIKKTGRLVVVQEAPTRGGFGSEILSVVAQECLADLKGVKLLGAKNTPIGSGFSEGFIVPRVEDIVGAAKALV